MTGAQASTCRPALLGLKDYFHHPKLLSTKVNCIGRWGRRSTLALGGVPLPCNALRNFRKLERSVPQIPTSSSVYCNQLVHCEAKHAWSRQSDVPNKHSTVDTVNTISCFQFPRLHAHIHIHGNTTQQHFLHSQDKNEKLRAFCFAFGKEPEAFEYMCQTVSDQASTKEGIIKFIQSSDPIPNPLSELQK